MRYLFLTLFTVAGTAAFCQDSVFSEDALISVIRNFHPVAKQTELDVKIADADLVSSRAVFDPVLSARNGLKEVAGVDYYEVRNIQLKVPLWYGIDLFTGHERITGSRLNPAQTPGTIEYIGVSVPVLQNLAIDRRRADVKQAKLFRQLSLIERKVVINNLLRDALDAYWSWWKAHEQTQLAKLTLHNAQARYRMVKVGVSVGERPAVDTTEAATQLQSLAMSLLEAESDLIQQRLNLSAFLWTSEGKQYELPDSIIPQSWMEADSLLTDTYITAAAAHPELERFSPKLESLTIDRKLKFQSLLPDLTLKYNQLGYSLGAATKNPWFDNNQRFEVKMSVPLLLSQGRGEFRRANLKIAQTKLELDNKRVQIAITVKQYLTEWHQTLKQIDGQYSMMNNLIALQRAEETKFNNGESALFFINARELAKLNASQKLIDLKAQNQKALNALRWASGSLH
ncbi:MAG: TolC family protein [Chitinophagaceae bacterium]|nr:MAG: TolC family protein [Chitinophagaceae bacterium]